MFIRNYDCYYTLVLSDAVLSIILYPTYKPLLTAYKKYCGTSSYYICVGLALLYNISPCGTAGRQQGVRVCVCVCTYVRMYCILYV